MDAAQLARLQRDALAEVLCEAVQDADRLVAEAQIGVHLLQHPVDIDLQGAGGCQGRVDTAEQLDKRGLFADSKPCHAKGTLGGHSPPAQELLDYQRKA